jgi:YbbR domain-containing protein
LKVPQFISSSHNIFFPLGAFSLATLVWLFVISGNEYTMILDFPIEARNLNAQKTYLKEVPKYASVMLKGKGRDLFKAYILRNHAGFKLVLDLEGISQEYEFILNQYFEKNPRKVVLPSSYKLSFLEVLYPNRIKISLDEIMTKNVPISSNISISLKDGYTQIGLMKFNPDSVVLVGPKVELAKIENVHTVKDTLIDLSYPFNGNLNLISPGRLINCSQTKIKYFLDIQQISERIIVDIPVKVINKLKGIRVFPSPQTVSLTVIGGAFQISEIKPEDILVTVDFKTWSMNKSFYAPQVTFPIDILDWRDLSPRTIELGVARESK